MNWPAVVTWAFVLRIFIGVAVWQIAKYAFRRWVGRRIRRAHLKGYEEGLRDGWNQHQKKLQIELKDKRPLLGEGYRDHAVAKVCACCGTRCLHCAKQDAETIEVLAQEAKIQRDERGRFKKR